MNDSGHTTNETLRKSIHIAIGFLAISLRYVPWRIAAAIAAVAAIGNWLLLHRLVVKSVARHARGYDAGIVLYPLAVCALILTFNWHIELAAVGWVILAFGDGFATLIGRAVPIAPLPWNRTKSWGGFLGFMIAAGIAVRFHGTFSSGTSRRRPNRRVCTPSRSSPLVPCSSSAGRRPRGPRWATSGDPGRIRVPTDGRRCAAGGRPGRPAPSAVARRKVARRGR